MSVLSAYEGAQAARGYASEHDRPSLWMSVPMSLLLVHNQLVIGVLEPGEPKLLWIPLRT